MLNRPRLLILDAHTSAGLACIRSLGQNSFEIHAASYRKCAHGLYSRFVLKRFLYPNPEENIPSFIEWLLAQMKQYAYTLVFPMTEATLLSIAQYRHQLPAFASRTIPSETAIYYTFNKKNTLALAHTCGISVPQSFSILALSQLQDLPLKFPVVLKEPCTGNIHAGKVRSGRGVFYPATPDALKKRLESGLMDGKEFLIQELLLGFGIGLSLLSTPQGILAPFAHRRLVEAHPTGSRAVVAERIPVPEILLPKIELFLQKAQFYGPVMFEFKECHGEWILLEVNGRFWGSLPLALSCGINFPLLFYQYLTDQRYTSLESNKYKQIHYLLGYAEHMIRTFQRKPLGWPGVFPKPMNAFFGFLQECVSGRPDFSFQADDLFPGWIEIVDRIGYGVQKLLKQ